MGKTRTSFRPGQSGNPLGRPRVCYEIRELARRYGPGCIAALAQMAGLTDKPAATAELVRVAAMKELLDRGYGRPVHPLADDASGPLIVDFRWADETPVLPPPRPPTIEAEAEDEPS